MMTLLKEDQIAIDLGEGLWLHSGGVREPGPRLIIDEEGVQGLDGSLAVRRDPSERPWSHGDFGDSGRYGPRYVSITGYALTDTPSQMYPLRDALQLALSPEAPRMIGIRQTHRGMRYLNIYGGELTWDRQTDTRARWKIEMYCPDPRFYGEEKHAALYSADLKRSGLAYNVSFPLNFTAEITAGESTPISNEGNAVAYPVYTFSGDTQGFTMTDGVRTMTYAGATQAGIELRINTFTGEVRYGDSDRSYLLTERKWLTVPPHSALTPTVDFLASPDTEGSLRVDVTWRDTYL